MNKNSQTFFLFYCAVSYIFFLCSACDACVLEQAAGMACEREHERVLGGRDDGNISTGPALVLL
jgi:hypothetical protein